MATLGTEPQVITLTLDALLKTGHLIRHVLILHTQPSDSSIQVALDVLAREFKQHKPYQSIDIDFVLFTSGEERPISDITTPDEAADIFRTLYHTVLGLKQQEHYIHLCTAGGRKAMAMYGMLVAQLLFDENDRLWLLLSTEAFRLGRQLHAREGEASLLRIPVIPWRLGISEKKHFIEHVLTPAETEVLELVARYGLTDKEIALRRTTTEKTVGHQLSTIYSKLWTFLGYRDDIRVDRHTIATEFGAYFDVMDALQGQVEI